MNEETVKIKPLLFSIRKICYNLIRTDQLVKRSYTTPLISRLEEDQVYPPLEDFMTPESISKLYFNSLVESTIRKELFT